MLEPELAPPLDDAETTARWMNGIVEKCIMLAPEQYMWLHRRFKTRPKARRPAIDFQDAILRVASCFSFKSSLIAAIITQAHN